MLLIRLFHKIDYVEVLRPYTGRTIYNLNPHNRFIYIITRVLLAIRFLSLLFPSLPSPATSLVFLPAAMLALETRDVAKHHSPRANLAFLVLGPPFLVFR